MASDPELHDFQLLVQALHEGHFSARVGWWLSLVAFDGVLDHQALNAIERGSCSVYALHAGHWVIEIHCMSGWLERRVLHTTTAAYIGKNAGVFFQAKDLRAVDRELAATHGLMVTKTHREFLMAARHFWAARLPGVLWSHCAGLSRFQLLDKHAWWRRETKQYAVAKTERAHHPIGCIVDAQKPSRSDSIESVAVELARIGKRIGSRDAGRKQMVEAIDQSLPVARLEGFANALALVALKEVVLLGGVQGRLLAPSSLGVYVGTTFVQWTRALAALGMEAESEDYVQRYDQIVEQHEPSQRPKSRALLLALHDRLIIRGSPLLGALHWVSNRSLPCSHVIWPHEVELALEYIDHAEADPRLRSQARLVVLLGHAIPLRTSEYFQIRLVDVFPGGEPTVVIYPRLRDGSHKSPHNRLHQDVFDERLSNALVQHKRQRLEEECLAHEDALPDLRLLGHPNDQQQPYAAQKTIDLVSRALHWATGNAWMGVYSLRHTTISRRSRECLESISIDSDVSAWEQNSRFCGHGSVVSTSVYVHDIEFTLRSRLDRCLPAPREILGMGDPYQPVALYLLYSPQARPALQDANSSQLRKLEQLSFPELCGAMDDLASGVPTTLIAAKCDLEGVAIAQLLALIKLLWDWQSAMPLLTHQDVLVALRRWSARARHLRQFKYTKLLAHIRDMAQREDLTAAIAFSQCLNMSLVGDHVTLDKGHWSVRLMRHMVNAGYKKSQLVARVNPHCVIPAEFASSVTHVRQSPRRGRPPIRLVLVSEDHDDAANAQGAEGCSTGLHWLSQILQLWLAIKGVM